VSPVAVTDDALRQLPSPPAIVPMLARAALASLPVGSRRVQGARDQPHATLALDDIAIDRDRLARYARVCGFDLSDALPATYPHVLAFGLQLALLTDPGFPLPAVGLVHTANRIEQRRPIDASERLSLRVGLGPIEPHPRGRSVTIRTEVLCAGESVWAEWSTMLSRGDGDESVPAAPGPPPAAELARSAEWRLPGDLGRRYAAVSGDRNPIHLHALTARLLGFRRPIVHGMWTIARCLAALGPALPRAFRAEVAFKRPILLPATVWFAEDTAPGGRAFGVRDARDGTPHLEGLISAFAGAQSGSAAAS
jgi:MaoC like domain